MKTLINQSINPMRVLPLSPVGPERTCTHGHQRIRNDILHTQYVDNNTYVLSSW